MWTKTYLFNLGLSAVLFSACSSDKNEPATTLPLQEETVLSMSQLKASQMNTCPIISGYYKCTENCETTEETSRAIEKPGLMILKSRQGQGYHFSNGEKKSVDLIDYLLSKYMLDDDGFIVDGLVYDKTVPIKTALETFNRQLQGFAGSVIRELFSEVGIADIDKELLKIDIPNIIAGYQATCIDGQLRIHYVVDKVAYKLKIKNINENVLEIKSYFLENGEVASQKGRFELVEESSVDDLSSPVVREGSPVASWLEEHPGRIQLENQSIYKSSTNEYLNIYFHRTDNNSSTNTLYYADGYAFWGREDKSDEESLFNNTMLFMPFGLRIYLDIASLKVFTRQSETGVEHEVGSIYEKDGRAYINLPLNCNTWFYSRDCKLVQE